MRAHEIGVRKTLGAGRSVIVWQMLLETALISTAALLLALCMVELSLPLFYKFLGVHLSMSYVLQSSPLQLFGGVFALWIVMILLCGVYPAYFLSGFAPATILRAFTVQGKQSGTLRKILVVTQFSVTVMLIIGVLIMTQQMKFIQAKNLGFDKENIVMLEIRNRELGKNINTLKSSLQQAPGVLAVSGCGNKLAGDVDGFMVIPEKGKTSRMQYMQRVDADYARTMGLTLVSGRWFSHNPLENIDKIIVNEAELQRRNAAPRDTNETSEIIGVVKNFHFSSLKDRIEPIVLNTPFWKNDSGFVEQYSPYSHLAVRLEKGNVQSTLIALETSWKGVVPNEPFEFSFLDDDLQAMYKNETRMTTLVNIFCGIALLVSSLGLLGLTAFTVERRTKEIGIRKVLGASVASIIGLLTKDFIKLVVLAIILAIPLGYWAAGQWLQDYAYRIELSWWMFALAGVAAVVIAFMTVAGQSWRAARANPVESLRTE